MRIEFSPKTKGVVAKRSAYRCNIPGCDRVTIGPGASSDDITCTGVASHIYSASPQGPRGNFGVSADQLSSPDNAIWLCSEHARLVDNNRGAKFPASLLLAYKSLHEARISREQQNIHMPFAWLHEISVSRGPVFLTPAKLTLGKVTVVVGENASGKTALWEWIMGIHKPSTLERWRPNKTADSGLAFTVTYFNPTQHSIAVEVDKHPGIKYRLDGHAVPYNPYPLRFIVLKEIRHHDREELNDLQRIALQLDTDSTTVENLLPLVGGEAGINVRKLWVSDESGELELRTDVRGTVPNLEFRALSSGEQAIVLIELATAMARFSAQYVPTVLIIEDVSLRLELPTLKRYVDLLCGPNYMFQTIVEVPEPNLRSMWTGCEVALLIGKRTGVVITQ